MPLWSPPLPRRQILTIFYLLVASTVLGVPLWNTFQMWYRRVFRFLSIGECIYSLQVNKSRLVKMLICLWLRKYFFYEEKGKPNFRETQVILSVLLIVMLNSFAIYPFIHLRMWRCSFTVASSCVFCHKRAVMLPMYVTCIQSQNSPSSK